MKAALKSLGWSQKDLAARVYVHENTVSLWSKGQRSVPGPVRAYLDLAVAVKALGV
ncbi:XRE family transcriptional regulator [Fulvimarina endophytica]|uniref:XRE family transcriptional regulator n=2 Tax=Fulvimarina endophytica TaxID=2293836 RepID=A0A371XB88_9HYPH|nr:XRE family transcriptional regulator [Fulvimarina endophytica]